jgi:outer membrane protein assembly factor BamB
MNMRPFLITCTLIGASLTAAAANWPAWRGPAANGASEESRFPTTWDRTNNVTWRVALPEPGNSCPVVWGERVFVTQAVGKKRALLCFDRKDGRKLWEAGPVYDQPERMMRGNNPYCAASPVTDGERVIAFFGSAGLYSFDFSGKEEWHAELGKIDHPFGSASSPCLDGDQCYVYVGPGTNETLVAVNKRTGKIAWRTDGIRPSAEELTRVKTPGPPMGSWSTPVVIDNRGRKELIMSFAFRYGGYDTQTGKLLWQSDGLVLQTYVTPLWVDGLLIPMSGGAAMAVRPPLQGEPETVWQEKRRKSRMGSGVTLGKHLYLLADDGIAECWEKETGKVLWQERLQGPGKKTSSWSSLSLAGNTIYAPNKSGDVFVFAAEPAFRSISTNSVDEPTNASLALSNGRVFMRTDKALWCFGGR